MEQIQVQLNPELTLIELLRVMPQSIIVLEDAGIDYCCKGASSIRAAAGGAGLTPLELLDMIALADDPEGQAWDGTSLTDLTKFLTHDHEQIASTFLSRLLADVEIAIRTHGALPLLRRIRMLTLALEKNLVAHEMEEECDLFPTLRELEAAVWGAHATPVPVRISQRVLKELLEHESLRDQLHVLADLTNRLAADCDVPALTASVRSMRAHLHHHMHLENNVLYPRALQIENDLRRRAQQEL